MQIRRSSALAAGLLTLSAVFLSAIPTARAQPLVRVPQDADLQQALNRVDDDGIVEIAAGNYPSPANGFRIRNPGRSFTVRAATGAQVILDGQGTSRILRFTDNAPPGSGQVVTFEGITFQNGFSTAPGDAGGVSISGGEVAFTGCTFRNHRATPSGTGGGAVRVADGARASFVNSEWSDNSAFNRGGALEVVAATADIVRNRFLRNRVNLPQHRPTSPGGAIYVLDAQVTVAESYFGENEAGWVGGALFVFGTWQAPESIPAARVVVANSTFVGNRAVGDPCCAVAPPTFGGAIHVEDQATLEVFNSRFVGNEANWGGALDSYRAIVSIEESVFRDNRALATPDVLAAGGAILASSSDFADASTNSGAVNRRTGEIHIKRTLLEGTTGGAQAQATQGGCLLATGDINRLRGQGGVAQDGDAATNRLAVELDEVIFYRCLTEAHATSPASGGAMSFEVVDLAMSDTVVLDSEARGPGGVGGGLVAFADSVLELSDSTFARNVAAQRGGGAAVVGSALEASDLRFFDNEVSPGVSEPVQESEGAALYVAPHFPPGQAALHRDVTGVVEDSLFVHNVGIPIYDVDLDAGPINDVRYNNNRFRSTAFGGRVYINNAEDFFGETVGELNNLVVIRSNGTRTDKSQVANQSLGRTPDDGQVVAAPSAVVGTSPPSESAAPLPAVLGYAWSGSAARLAGSELNQSSGITEVTAPATYNLRVAGSNVDRATVGDVACSNGPLLCANSNRFRVTVDWRTSKGERGTGQIVPVPPEAAADDSGLYFFFTPDNWEMLLKVIDGCAFNDRFWVFSAATTNVEFTLRVTDTLSGATRSYFKPIDTVAPAITDTDAFATCDVVAGPATSPLSPRPRANEAPAPILWDTLAPRHGAAGQAACVPGPAQLCLNDSRFAVEIDWRSFDGDTGTGQRVPFGSDDSGLIFFFEENNWEMLVKILDGCGFNNRFWVFFAATTTVEFRLRVTDTETGAVREYTNPLGTPADTVLDTDGFATCP